MLLLRVGLVATGIIYAARGLLIVPELIAFTGSSGAPPFRELVFSGVSLAVGGAYLLGTALHWKALARST